MLSWVSSGSASSRLGVERGTLDRVAMSVAMAENSAYRSRVASQGKKVEVKGA
jgi:hypothetical protein